MEPKRGKQASLVKMIDDYAGIINGVMWTQVVLGVIFVALRLYTRVFLIRSIGWDDLLMIVNLVCCISHSPLPFSTFSPKLLTNHLQITFIGYVGCITVGVQYGIGKRYADVPPEDYSKAIMWEVIGQAICIMGIAASKSSVAVLLLRIVVLKWHRWLLWFCIVSTTTWCTVTTVLLFLQSKPTAFL